MAVVVSIAPTSEAALPAVVLMDTHSSQIKLHAKQMASYFHITEGMLLASEQFLCASSEVYIVYDSGCYARKLGQFAGSLTGLQNCVTSFAFPALQERHGQFSLVYLSLSISTMSVLIAGLFW